MNRIFVLVSLLGTLTAGDVAEAVSLNPMQGVSAWQFSLENDLWAIPSTDRWYTNGARLSWTYESLLAEQAPITAAIKSAASVLPMPDGAGRPPGITYTLGQNIYTPADIRNAAPQPTDRPWAAWLYLGVTAHGYRGDTFFASDLKLGVAGRYALGDTVQTAIHELVDSSRPRGWDNQLGTRVGIQLSHLRLYSVKDTVLNDHVGIQYGGGVAVGTLKNYATASATAVISPLEPLNGFDQPISTGFEGDFVVHDVHLETYRRWLVFVTLSATYSAYNYFLSNNTRYGSDDVEPLSTFGAVQVGFSIPSHLWCNGCPRAVFAQTTRSAEFDTPILNKRERYQRYATIQFVWPDQK